jgi:hypothetical protein
MQSVDNLTNNYFEIKLIKIKQASNYEDEIDGIKLPEYKTYENKLGHYCNLGNDWSHWTLTGFPFIPKTTSTFNKS